MAKFLADEPIMAFRQPALEAPKVEVEQQPTTIAMRMLNLFDKGKRWCRNRIYQRSTCDDPKMCLLGALGAAIYGERWINELPNGDDSGIVFSKLKDEPVTNLLYRGIRKREGYPIIDAKARAACDIYHYNDFYGTSWQHIESLLLEVHEEELKAMQAAPKKA